tara:strand:+ start:5628 stop:6962 length:1335 start_codon:yes stop_codon:yes gene_type:complete
MKIENKILELIGKNHEDNYLSEFIPGKTYIPVTQKHIDKHDIIYLTKSVMQAWFTSGQYYKEFEEAISNKIGSKARSLFVNSGSSANLLALSTLCQRNMLEDLKLNYIKPGDEIITAAAGFPTTINPIFQNNLKPVFVDINIENLNVDIDKIKRAFSKKTKAIMLAHTLGNPFRVDLFRNFCDENSIFLIEDTCDAFGSTINLAGKERLAGSFGDFSTLSFYPAHHITTGEGGAVITSNKKLRRIAASVRDWGRHCWCDSGCDNTCKKRFNWKFEGLPEGYDHKYIYGTIGYNLKATDMQAALGCSQIKKLDKFIEIRRKNWNILKNIFTENKVFKKNFDTVSPTDNTNPSWFGFAIICRKHINRNKLLKFLEFKNIGTRLLFGGNITSQPAYKNLKFKISGNLNNSNIVKDRLFWIGVHPNINLSHINYIAKTLEEGVKKQVT